MIEVELPDGRVVEIDTKDPQEAMALVKQMTGGGGDTPRAEAQMPEGANPALEAVSAGARGANKGLTDVLGAPVDLVNYGLKQVGLGSDNPFGGSKMIRRGMDNIAKMVKPDHVGMAYEDAAEIPRDVRWAARGGEAIGSSVLPAAAPMAAARNVNLAAAVAPSLNPFQSAIVQAARNPGANVARETAITMGGAQGAALAGALAPDSDVAAAAGQVVGSVATPTSLIAQLGGKTVGAAKDFANSFTKEGRMRAAADHVGKLLDAGGEDAGKLLKNLDAPDVLAGKSTIAERTKSPTMLGVEERAMANSPDFRKRIEATRDAASGDLSTALRAEVGTGDVTALKRAALGQQEEVTTAVENFIDDAMRRASQAADTFRRDPTGAGRQTSQLQAAEVLDQAYSEARSVERGLWNAVDLNQPLAPQNFLTRYRDLLTERRMTMGQLDGGLAREARRYAALMRQGTPIPARDIKNLRSELLDFARDARADRNMKQASIYADLADELLADLAPIDRLGTARDFSRALHDKWSRTFGGQTQARASSGADKIADELTLDKAMSGGSSAANMKFREMREAAMPVQGRGADYSGDMTAAQEAYLRDRIGAMRGPDGTLDAGKAHDFVQKNAELLGAFPNIRRDLMEAGRAQGAALEAIDNANRAAKVTMRQSAFARVVAAGEAPHMAVQNTLNGARPTQGYRELATLAQRGGEEALAGLRSATFDLVQNRAAKFAKDYGGYWHAMERVLAKDPVSPGNPSIMKLMRDAGAVNATQQSRLLQIVKRGVEMERAAKAGRYVKDLGPQSDDFFDFFVRVAGANYGSSVSLAGSNSGAPLVAASYGSKFFRKIFEQVPQQKVADIVMQSLEDEKLFRQLLQKVDSAPAAKRVMSAINGALQGGAVMAAGADDSEERMAAR
jgi:hypothetical protein